MNLDSFSFLWHDYETFGVTARSARPAQFAAIRTDARLNEVGEPINLHCRATNDFLPEPQSCLITGITPWTCLEKGLPEYQFARKVLQVLAQPGTVGVGYNTMRFDDEITRFMLWRNLYDPYTREWKNRCGRWDLIDVTRAAYALRPQGISWPTNDDGAVSFKLEDLSCANGLIHDSAHDALSDVRATIYLARLIRDQQPKLFDYCLELRDKNKVKNQIRLMQAHPFIHVSGMFGVQRGCLAIMWPLAQHPNNSNEIIAWDLAHNPDELADLSPEVVRQRLFTSSVDMPKGVTRLPIKSIHVNKSPFVAGNLKILNTDTIMRWGIDLDQIMSHAELAKRLPNLSTLWKQVYGEKEHAINDVDEDLYNRFLGRTDRSKLDSLRESLLQDQETQIPSFEDSRLDELIFRYRARNFPSQLNASEKQRWEAHRAARLLHGAGGALQVERYLQEIDQLAEDATPAQQEILNLLVDYAQTIIPTKKT